MSYFIKAERYLLQRLQHKALIDQARYWFDCTLVYSTALGVGGVDVSTL
jgi:hypothetical protein